MGKKFNGNNGLALQPKPGYAAKLSPHIRLGAMTRSVAVLCFALALASCADEQYIGRAESAAQKVAAELASGNLDAIWYKASAEVKRAHTLEDARSRLAGVPASLAKAQRIRSNEPEVRYREGLVYVQLYYVLGPPEEQSVEEVLTFRLDHHGLVDLVRYDLKLPAQAIELAGAIVCPQPSSGRGLWRLFAPPPKPITHCPDFRRGA